jgi:hypothetical protein
MTLRSDQKKRAQFWCRSCGMVRDSDVAPWCRHNDGDRSLQAQRMEPLPSWHPLWSASRALEDRSE